MALASFREELSADARRLWNSPTERRAAFQAIVQAKDPVAKREAIERVDRAILEALNALGLPRGPIRGLELWPEVTGWNGRKHPDCTLFLSEIRLTNAVRFNEVDDFFSSWIHESIHARQVYLGDTQEYREWPGYEEGLVATLTHLILTAGGINDVRSSFSYYVKAYEVFSTAVDVELSALLPALWSHPTGSVRHVFEATVNELRSQSGKATLDRLQLAGDVLFRFDRWHDEPNPQSMRMLAQRILR
jgi:hypothetical protein